MNKLDLCHAMWNLTAFWDLSIMMCKTNLIKIDNKNGYITIHNTVTMSYLNEWTDVWYTWCDMQYNIKFITHQWPLLLRKLTGD